MAKTIGSISKFRAKHNYFLEKFGKEIQSLIYPTEERTVIPPGGSVLPPRKPLPPGVYEEIIQKRRFRYVGGFWKKPELSAVELARIKRRFVLAGYEWPVEPHFDLVRHFKNTRSAYYHPDKLVRLEKIEAFIKDKPDAMKEYKRKVMREKAEDEDRSFKKEQEVYVYALNAEKSNNPDYVQENMSQSKLKKEQTKQSVIVTKKKKKK